MLFEYRRVMGYTPDEVRAMSRRQILEDVEYLAQERNVQNAQAKLRLMEAQAALAEDSE